MFGARLEPGARGAKRSGLLAVLGAAVLQWGGANALSAEPLTDEQIRQRIIAASIAAYPGNCPCPYHTYRAGRACGKRSAWSRPGGQAPLCFPQDISAEHVKRYRQQALASVSGAN